MLSMEEHLDDLLRHLEKVRQTTQLLGKRLIASGRAGFGRNLIANGLKHDNSKFSGVEWSYLHAGRDVPKDVLDLAIEQHRLTNFHHPEFWSGINEMPEIYLAEMVCDFSARSQEFGTGLRDWIEHTAIMRYNPDEKQLARINGFVDMLLENSFK